MAVQAHHHPSTFFFLNRNGQEGNDCSPESHKAQFSSINAEVNSRKRAREVSSVIDLENTLAAPMNPPPPTPPQVITHRGGRRQPQNVVSTGLRLSPGLSQQCTNREQRLPSLSMLPGDFAGEMKRQSDELDRFLQIQGEQLRRMLVETNERHYRELISTTEESVRRRLREKETEMEKATRRHAELESRVAQIERERQAWQVRATAREAEASSLQARLQQALANRGGTVSEFEGVDETDDAESGYVDPERIEFTGPNCRICRQRSATVLALPCRHLVLCTGCDASVRLCPVCLNSKNSSVEVFFS